MNIDQIERRRERLSRHYAIAVRKQMRALGFEKPSRYQDWRYWVENQFLPHYFMRPPGWRIALRERGEKRTLPDFCVIGPVKGGSSDLAVSLLLHPNVTTPLAKEIMSSQPDAWPLFYPSESEKARHAKRHGKALNPYLTPDFQSVELIHNMSRLSPHAKIVITLRNPVQRVYSHWKWEVFMSGRQRAATLPFLSTFPAYVDHCLGVFPECPTFTACGHGALQTSIYWKAVSLWMEAFGRENVLVLDVGEYLKDRNSMLRRIYDFVGLPDFVVPAAANNVNENPLRLPPPDQASLDKLEVFFKPFNAKLWDVIGKEFEW